MAFRILVADDHELVRRGLRALLRKDDWEICGEAQDGVEAVEQAKRLKPDVVIIDIGMPNSNGLDATREIVKARPQTRVLVLTLYDSEEMVQQVLQAGARGFILKSDAAQDLLTALEALRRNQTFFSAKVSDVVLDGYASGKGHANSAAPQRRLTSRERELVQLLAEGKSTRQAAGQLGMSVKTAETHRSNIMRKLQLHSASELVLYAVRNKLVQVS